MRNSFGGLLSTVSSTSQCRVCTVVLHDSICKQGTILSLTDIYANFATGEFVRIGSPGLPRIFYRYWRPVTASSTRHRFLYETIPSRTPPSQTAVSRLQLTLSCPMNQRHHVRSSSHGRKVAATHARPSKPAVLHKRGHSYNHALSQGEGSSPIGRSVLGGNKKIVTEVTNQSDDESDGMAGLPSFWLVLGSV